MPCQAAEAGGPAGSQKKTHSELHTIRYLVKPRAIKHNAAHGGGARWRCLSPRRNSRSGEKVNAGPIPSHVLGRCRSHIGRIRPECCKLGRWNRPEVARVRAEFGRVRPAAPTEFGQEQVSEVQTQSGGTGASEKRSIVQIQALSARFRATLDIAGLYKPLELRPRPASGHVSSNSAQHRPNIGLQTWPMSDHVWPTFRVRSQTPGRVLEFGSVQMGSSFFRPGPRIGTNSVEVGPHFGPTSSEFDRVRPESGQDSAELVEVQPVVRNRARPLFLHTT